MSHTTPTEVKDRWLVSEPAPEDATLQVLINDAEDTILAAIPDLEERIADERIPVTRLQKIVSRMVIRHLQNPQGIRQTQETTGPFTKGLTYGGDEPGSIYLTADERRELLGRKAGRAFQIDTLPARTVRSLDAEWS